MGTWGYNYLIELKTLWEKEKLLATSSFSFSRNVFKSCLLLMHQNEYLRSKGLKHIFTEKDSFQIITYMSDIKLVLESRCQSTYGALLVALKIEKLLQLTHSHTMTPFDASRKQAFRKHCGKRRNCS